LDEATAVTTGIGLTVTRAVAADVQPLGEVAVAVYEVVVFGDTVIEAPEKLPGIHVIVFSKLEAVNVCESPAQIGELLAVRLMLGEGMKLTIIS